MVVLLRALFFSKNEKDPFHEITNAIVERVETPHQAFSWLQTNVAYVGDPSKLKSSPHGRLDDWGSLQRTTELGLGDEDEFAIASAAMLADNGYPPKILLLEGKLTVNGREYFMPHTVHLLERRGKYGSVGTNEGDTQLIPEHDTIEALLDSWDIGEGVRFDRYKVVDLREIKGIDYVHGRGNFWFEVTLENEDKPWTYLPREEDITVNRTKGK